MAYRDKRNVLNGKIVLYKRTSEGSSHRSESWYAKFKIPNSKAHRCSLKTEDFDEAKLLAEEKFFDLSQRARRGLSLQTFGFRSIATKYLSEFEMEVRHGEGVGGSQVRGRSKRYLEEKKIAEKYLINFFDALDLQRISAAHVERYKDFRRTYWTLGPGSLMSEISYERNGRAVTRAKNPSEQKEPSVGTLNKELTVLRKIFSYAVTKQFIEPAEVPEIRRLKGSGKKVSKRSGFTERQVQHLIDSASKRCMETKRRNLRQGRQQELIVFYMTFLALTGLRVTEANRLRFNDCETVRKNGEEYLQVFVAGKGKSRKLIGLDESRNVLNYIRELHMKNSILHHWEFKPDMHVFADQYGKKVGSFKRGIDAALKNAGLLWDEHGQKRSAGSFRKYYITQALVRGQVSHFELAKQCGTSVSTIEKYYAEIDVTENPEKWVFETALTPGFVL